MKRKAKKPTKALALIQKEEPTLQVLAREFDEFIRGVQEQEGMHAGSVDVSPDVAALAKPILTDSSHLPSTT